MSKLKIWNSGWIDPPNIRVHNGTNFVDVARVKVFTAAGWVEVWPVGLGLPSSTVIDADWIVLKWWPRDGEDFDIRAYVCVPDIGQDQSTLIGWDQANQFPAVDPLITWGGDYQGLGDNQAANRNSISESTLLDVEAIKTAYPTATEIRVVMRGFWYDVAGSLGVVPTAHLYTGGTPSITDYLWTVSGSTADQEIQQSNDGVVITEVTTDSTTQGQYMTTFVYTLATTTAEFVQDETGCPIPETSGPTGTIYYTAEPGSVIGLIDFVRDPVEDWATGFTVTEKQIVTVPAGTFGAVPVPTKVSVQWVDTIQVLYYQEFVYAIPWSGPFPPAGYTGVNVSYNGSKVYDPTGYTWNPTLNQFEEA